ncbi:polypeptide-transport-associated domain-containing protein [Caballeronia sordidicola]|uniref:Polypeptide-transport-associated domain-containing protein n=1 Tax=Caballeronia sordidicola TaxID=196367 RepID=A0A158HAB7_CABSO|nr:ShlB/FhaC/HecB family hemolysin secretion/activation protein [Caballeronia sordidicola]SAL41268.1 polypeptide-transport-associated domain-containing protein [Caballeronia sordidicola]
MSLSRDACHTLFAVAAGLAFLSAAGFSTAQVRAPGIDAQRRQDEQRQQTEERANERPSVLTEAPSLPVIDLASLPQETPCFPVRELHLLHNPFSWLDARLQPVIGACIGKQAIRVIGEAANNALIERGYITSRVLIPEQNLATGVLNMDVVAGRIGAVRVATSDDWTNAQGTPSTSTDAPTLPASAASTPSPAIGPEIGWSRMVLPTYPGAIYNQRDADQALESIRRLSGQADTAFDIQPGNALGESVLLIKPAADPLTSKRWHATIGADNYGIDSTGRFNLNGTFTFDSPLHLYDQLTLSGSTNADFTDHQKASRSGAVNWNVPLGYASFFVNASTSRYLQTVAGYMEPQQYRGDSAEVNAGIGFVPYRSASARTSVQAKLYHRFNHAYLDDQTLDYQARDLIGVEATLSHQQFIGPAVVSGGAGWRQTLLGVTKLPGSVLGEPGWDSKTKILTGNLQATIPFTVASQSLRYSGQFNWQHAYTRLIPNDDFTIGSPYTVRGFDGQTTLAAESGWVWRNELGLSVAGQMPFVAFDTGRVSGPNVEYLLGQTLMGAALGLRGHLPASRYAAIDYELTLGWPVVKPRGFPSGPALMFQASTLF